MPKALSLKYRPTKFSDLIGQDSISQTLSLALETNKVSHAYLFSGLRGSGKTSSARIFAKALQCEKFPTSVPCGECDSCKSVQNNSHMDIIEMDAASSRSINDIKDLIEQVQYRPAYGRFKIFIIDEIHMLTNEAFNALLKTLEEPPEYVKFILATTDPLKLPATILSRTQHFRFKKIPQSVIATHLKRILGLEKVQFEDSALDLLARNCGGSLRDALTLLEQSIIFSQNNITLQSISNMLGALNPSVIEEFFEAILSHDEAKVDELLSEFESYEVENIIDEMIIFLKNKILSKDYKYNTLIVDRFFRIFAEAKNMLSLNAESSFVLILLTLKLKESLNIEELDKMIAKIEQEVLQNIPMPNPTQEQSQQFTQQPAQQQFTQQKSTQQLAESSQNKPAPNPQNIQNTPPTNSIDTAKIPPKISPIKSKFEQLIAKIYERNYEIGELFEKNYTFVDFNNSVLTWESKANEADKAKLGEYGKVIKAIVSEIFGANTKIQAKTTNTAPKLDSQKEPELIKDIENIFPITDKKIIDKKVANA